MQMSNVLESIENILAVFCTVFFFGIKVIDVVWSAFLGIFQFIFFVGMFALVLYGVGQLPQPLESIVFTVLFLSFFLCGFSTFTLMAWKPERLEKILDSLQGHRS